MFSDSDFGADSIFETNAAGSRSTSLVVQSHKSFILPSLTLDKAKWSWTSEMSAGTAPNGERHFRKVFMVPEGKTPLHARIVSVVDDSREFFVNMKIVGQTAKQWDTSQHACVALAPCLNVFAINATNFNGPAGFVATIQVTYVDGTQSTLVTDSSWRVDATSQIGYETLSFDDSTWPTAYTIGYFGAGPWSTVALSAIPCPCKSAFVQDKFEGSGDSKGQSAESNVKPGSDISECKTLVEEQRQVWAEEKQEREEARQARAENKVAREEARQARAEEHQAREQERRHEKNALAAECKAQAAVADA
ncbi:hypothetical protein B0H11DRAFT_2236939 [Mycena galericulata]|nr:hypothetical protein B0H11DRAFT_2236939 [Mycena galericulata]